MSGACTKNDVIYADCAATRPLSDAVRAAMEPYLDGGKFGNASSSHRRGRDAARAVLDARRRIAEVLGCDAREIYFTSGGTESDNWAIKGTALAHHLQGHLVTSAIEHHAVLHACDAVKKLGMECSFAMPDREGVVSADAVDALLQEDTRLVSVMLANNEIGTVQPISEIARAVHARGAILFCDAVQGMGQIPVRTDTLGADLLALSGHKLGAPIGIGLLYICRGTQIVPLLDGGAQEMGMRAGTENAAAIVGLAAAVEEAAAMRGVSEITAVREYLFERLLAIPGCIANGTRAAGKRLAGNVNVSFPGLDAESMVLHLDRMGIQCSAGSACTAGRTEASHVLLAIGCDEARASSSLRLTFGAELTREDADVIVSCVEKLTARLRSV